MAGVSKKRLALIVLAACVALAAVFSEAFVFSHIDHDCIGEDCPVCLQIETALNLLEGLGLLSAITLFCVLKLYSRFVIKKINSICIALMTPVTLKIKLNS
jgi:hypothetical protein